MPPKGGPRQLVNRHLQRGVERLNQESSSRAKQETDRLYYPTLRMRKRGRRKKRGADRGGSHDYPARFSREDSKIDVKGSTFGDGGVSGLKTILTEGTGDKASLLNFEECVETKQAVLREEACWTAPDNGRKSRTPDPLRIRKADKRKKYVDRSGSVRNRESNQL